MMSLFILFFFFSSRRRHTRLTCDWSSDVCSSDLVRRRLDKTFQAFFVRVRRGEKPGFPRFRSFRRYDSITFPSYGDGCRWLEDGKLRIQGTGLVKVKLHRPRIDLSWHLRP